MTLKTGTRQHNHCIYDENKQRIAEATTHQIAAEIVKRWNAHETLVQALRDVEWAYDGHCPQCVGPCGMHLPKCALAAALATWQEANHD